MEIVNEDILVKYLEGTLPEEEVSAVECWLAASTENQNTLEQLYFTIQVTNRLQVMNTVNPDQALLRFKSRVKKQNKQGRIHRIYRTVERVAAVLLIPVLVLSVYVFMQKGEKTVRMLEMRTNPGVVSSFNLPDGTKVWLNANSILKYPSDFKDGRRLVELNGQGYFEVTKDAHKPFIVKADMDYAVEVLGTKFNVSAYKDDEKIETTLVEGSVQINLGCVNRTISHKIKPNERAEFNKMTNQLEIVSVNTDYDTAWRNGEIIFRSHPMEQVLKVLSRHYHVEFDVKDTEIMKSIITARFKDEQLPQVMEYLKLASGIKYEIHKPTMNENTTTDIPIVEISK